MMYEDPVKNETRKGRKPSRREFLEAAAAIGLACGAPAVFGEPDKAPGVTSGVEPPDFEPGWLRRENQRARVVDVSSASVLQASVLDPVELGEMLDLGIEQLTEERNLASAWRAILGDANRILLKFNAVGAVVIKTNDVLAQVLIDRLASAGYSPANIMVVETPSYIATRSGAVAATEGWGDTIRVGNDWEQLRSYVEEADAIINVPTLKTHQIAGMSGCLKNISHAVIRHPARFHDNGCSPYVAQVVGAKAISSKIKLNLMNALRMIVNRGPEARNEDILDYGGLLLGYDPVSVDAIAMNTLVVERRRKQLGADLDVRYLAAAAEMNLGRWRVADIDRITLKTGPR